MSSIRHLTTDELHAGLDLVRLAPKDNGTLEMIVRRPRVEEREVLAEGELDTIVGLVGDCWIKRGSSSMPDGSSNPAAQLTIINSRAIALVAPQKDRRVLAGDQLFVDMDLSLENLPAGTRLAIGTAMVEVSALPHTGCKKFVARFGLDAMKFVNSPLGRQLNLRGINCRVVQAGVIKAGDAVSKIIS